MSEIAFNGVFAIITEEQYKALEENGYVVGLINERVQVEGDKHEY